MDERWHADDLDLLTAEEVRARCAVAPSYVAGVDDFGYTPLLAACEKASIEIAKVLLEAGADPNFRAPDGMTPLKAAIPSHPVPFDRALFDLLFRAGADPNVGFEPPLHIAVASGCQHLVAYLVEHGADPNLDDGDGSTPLFWAGAYSGQPDIRMMRVLVELGADVTRRDGIGRTVEAYIGPRAMREVMLRDG